MPRFSDTVMEHFQAPRNQGKLPFADSVGVVGVPGQGPFFVLYLRIANNVITDARFECNGCGVTIACGSMLTELITGNTLDDCSQLDADDVIVALDGLPVDKRHCSTSAIAALHQAVRHPSDKNDE